jgi:Secretion system C-terminal sorting domain
LFFLNVEIIGSISGVHSPLEYYYFKDGNEAYLKIPRSNIDPIMALLDFDIDLLLPYFTKKGLNPDFNGIRKVADDTHYTIFAEHFSEVRLGVPTSPTSIEEFTREIPTEYSLNQNYPNPFNPSTSISYSIPSDGHVTLAIYDILGNEVAVLENDFKSAGSYSKTFDAHKLTSGIYFYTIRSGKFVDTKKMLLMK